MWRRRSFGVGMPRSRGRVGMRYLILGRDVRGFGRDWLVVLCVIECESRGVGVERR